MLQHVRERMDSSLEMNSLTQVIYQRGLAFTYLNFKNLELLSEAIQQSLLTTANVKLFRSNGTQVTLPATPSYNSATHTVTWTLGSVLRVDTYRLEISTAVTDLAGKALEGEWMNQTNLTPDQYSDDPPGRAFTSG